MIHEAYTLGVKAALKKFGMDYHDFMYPGRQGQNPRLQQPYQTMRDIWGQNKSDYVWNMFNTKEAPGSSSGFGEESSFSTP